MRRYSAEDIRRAMTLYVVTDGRDICGASTAERVRAAIKGGATCVQLRAKDASRDEVIEAACRLLPMCRASRVPLIVNDDAEAAALAGADGVHVGQGDMSPKDARAIVGEDAIIGVSVKTAEQAAAAEAAGADHLGAGAAFATSTKADTSVITRDAFAAICAAVSIPVVAIGGIDERSIDRLSGLGLAGAAVVSAVFGKPDVERACKVLRALSEDRIVGRRGRM